MLILARYALALLVPFCWNGLACFTRPQSGLSNEAAVRWQHPAGLVTVETIGEVKSKIATQDWARRIYASRKGALDRWVVASADELRQIFPGRRGNVYHNFSCPRDRCRLKFDPLEPREFECPVCGTIFPPQTNAGIYRPDERYVGTMYDGWVCLFHLEASQTAADLGLVGRIELAAEAAKYYARGVDILLLYADTIEKLSVRTDDDPQMAVLLTYHREGDSAVLYQLACAYELLRDHMTREQRERFERVVLLRMLNEVMLEPIYRYNHNNLYQWHRTVIQVALALERDDVIDWSFGYGHFDPDRQPEHRSLRRLVATHFQKDGAFWEMCSGYHLYPLNAFCEVAVISRNLSASDSQRFPAAQYDLTATANPGSNVIRNALHWFMSMALPDRTMPTIGDSMAPRAGMSDYVATAEVGYRYFDLQAVGDYEPLRNGQRSWEALLYGAPQIVSTALPYTSAYLSSGWISLRNEWQGNKVWIGLNALVPGGGHQHADRLSLLSYSHGKLLALEKATPYNENVTRELGTFSQSHNTVTVDQTSQKQGEALSGNEAPLVAYFFAPSVAQFAELHADQLYPQANVYRRSIILIEDIYVDMFRVQGGTVHDWMMHHAGEPPRCSVPMSEGTFTPSEWLAGGTQQVRYARVENTWDVRWTVDEVTSRLTIMGAAGTNVFALETYPTDNAVITPHSPPCQTLCVRRTNDEPFLVVGDAWIDQPNLQAVTRGAGCASLRLQTAANTYYLLLESGSTRFEDGVILTSDAHLSLMRNRDAVMIVDGTKLEIESPEGVLRVATNKPCSLSAERHEETVTCEISGNIQYDTQGGADHHRELPVTVLSRTGDLWPIAK
ncbi:MAG: heparinase II/III domain-containing protein [Pirellulaceae bacterium]